VTITCAFRLRFPDFFSTRPFLYLIATAILENLNFFALEAVQKNNVFTSNWLIFFNPEFISNLFSRKQRFRTGEKHGNSVYLSIFDISISLTSPTRLSVHLWEVGTPKVGDSPWYSSLMQPLIQGFSSVVFCLCAQEVFQGVPQPGSLFVLAKLTSIFCSDPPRGCASAILLETLAALF